MMCIVKTKPESDFMQIITIIYSIFLSITLTILKKLIFYLFFMGKWGSPWQSPFYSPIRGTTTPESDSTYIITPRYSVFHHITLIILEKNDYFDLQYWKKGDPLTITPSKGVRRRYIRILHPKLPLGHPFLVGEPLYIHY